MAVCVPGPVMRNGWRESEAMLLDVKLRLMGFDVTKPSSSKMMHRCAASASTQRHASEIPSKRSAGEQQPQASDPSSSSSSSSVRKQTDEHTRWPFAKPGHRRRPAWLQRLRLGSAVPLLTLSRAPPLSAPAEDAGRFRFWIDYQVLSSPASAALLEKALVAVGGVKTGGPAKLDAVTSAKVVDHAASAGVAERTLG